MKQYLVVTNVTCTIKRRNPFQALSLRKIARLKIVDTNKIITDYGLVLNFSNVSVTKRMTQFNHLSNIFLNTVV